MKISIVYKEEKEWYIGHLQKYPDYESQGETLDELKKNLLDIYHDIQQGLVSGVKPSKVLEFSI